ncbi:triple tyrosine motif-containing protein, partial [Arthrospira platensis SPKY1]|nr:triple tyrosine motif-containing protein [Arthrospira platensis SPKY1]
MLEDHKGFLWIAVNKMIARLSPDLQELKVFDKDDGLQDGDYSNEAAFFSPTGTMYFGGSRGLSYFNPDKVQTNQKAVKVYLTGMQLYNQMLQPQLGTVLDSSLMVKRHLILPHNHRELVFEFTGINYTNPNKNIYAYTIENLQTEWIYTDADNRIANYFQIPPGNYTLLVKAANSSGVWDETPAQLKITVLP